ncbi:MAG: hypothetical protein ACTJHE_08575 [Vibrio casei]
MNKPNQDDAEVISAYSGYKIENVNLFLNSKGGEAMWNLSLIIVKAALRSICNNA